MSSITHGIDDVLIAENGAGRHRQIDQVSDCAAAGKAQWTAGIVLDDLGQAVYRGRRFAGYIGERGLSAWYRLVTAAVNPPRADAMLMLPTTIE